MLTEQYGHLDLSEVLLSLDKLNLFPQAEDRARWAKISNELKSQWITQAEKYLAFTWPALIVERYLNYNRKGDNVSFLFPFFERRSVLGAFVLAECIEGEGRFIDQILNGVFCICEETTWMTPFDLSNFKEVVPSPEDRIVDLSCSETGALLAWAHYLLKKQLDEISPRVCERIETEVRQRLMQPYMEHDDYWWMGFVETPVVNNWNPWCNSNMLVCFLLLESEQEARGAALLKVMRSLDVFIRRYPADGCCQEGPMYWGAAGGGLHTCLWLLNKASVGQIDIFADPTVQLIGQYIYKVHIHDDYFVDFADGDARVKIGMQAYNYGLSIGDERLIQLGANVEKTIPRLFNWFNMYDCLQDLFIEFRPTQVKAPYISQAWMEHSQVMTARELEGSERGLYLAAKGGTNSEPHNHNDVGNFIVYADGLPVFIDLGTEEYTAKTFSSERYDIWYLQSQFHNCPTINEVLQKNGPSYYAAMAECQLSDDYAELRLDIGDAYPTEAGIISWQRSCRLNRGANPSVKITDKFALKEASEKVTFSLVTLFEPQITGPGIFELEYALGKRVIINYDVEHLLLNFEKIELTESRLRKNWGDTVYRILLTAIRSEKLGTRELVVTRAL